MKPPSPVAPPPVGLALSSLVPPPEFTHASTLHGQAHVARVMVHAFRLIAVTGWTEEAPALWAAVYLHDIARNHDGVCHRHGGDAMRKFEARPDLRALFAQGGVTDSAYAAVGHDHFAALWPEAARIPLARSPSASP